MPKFKYVARVVASSKKISGEIEATDEQSAAKLLASQGMQPTKISPDSGGAGGFINKYRGRTSGKDKVVFIRQLSTLVNASLPLLQSLRLVAEQTNNKKLKAVIESIADEIEGGVPFSKAMGKYPDVFNPVFTGVIAAGEASGTLNTSLDRLAIQQERDSDIIGKVRGAMVYPLIILAVLLLVVLFMVVKVMPQVQSMYAGLASGISMPIVTRLLLGMASAITKYWFIVTFLVIGGVYFLRQWMKTQAGISAVDNAKLHWPVIGGIMTKLYMARFARISSTLLASGLPLLQVLQITASAIDNVHVEKSITEASEKVRGGKALSETLTGDRNFLPLVPNMIKIGEQSGALETMMGKTADYFEKEVDGEVSTLSTTIEPVMMIVMGVFALVVVAAILLPIYTLVGKNISIG